jgi:hypothetical protein
MSAAAHHHPRDAGASLQIGGDIMPTLCVKTGAVVARAPNPVKKHGHCARALFALGLDRDAS